MKRKKSTNSISFVAMLGFLAIIVVLGGVGTLWVKKARQNSITITRMPMTIVNVNETAKKYVITGEYPLFSDELSTVNKAVEKSVKDHLDEFIKTATTNWDERTLVAQTEEEKPHDPFQCFISWEPQQLNSKYISVIIRMSSYTGGANTIEDSMTFNYDIERKQFLTIEDLYPGQKDVLAMVSTYVKEDLKSQYAEELAKGALPLDMLEEGTKPVEENFSRFTFDSVFVTVYFPKYQVAPGVYGEQKVMVPRALTGVN